jgi:hypothetical protein
MGAGGIKKRALASMSRVSATVVMATTMRGTPAAIPHEIVKTKSEFRAQGKALNLQDIQSTYCREACQKSRSNA